MAIRKEQVLALGCLLVGLLLWRSAGEPAPRVQFAPQKKEYAPSPIVHTALVTTPAPKLTPKPWFREPSETQPLPPRELPFPLQEPLFLVALPLDPGPDLAHGEWLRIPGTVVEGVTLQAPGEGAAGRAAGGAPGDGAADASTAGEAPQGRAAVLQRWSHVYDQLVIEGLPPALGNVTADGVDPFDLEAMKDFTGVVIHFRRFDETHERLSGVQETFGVDSRMKVIGVQLAGTLKNEVARHIRAVPNDPAYVQKRQQLIDWLLLKAREDATIYDKALEQVDVLGKYGDGLEGKRARVRVLQARGDVAGELQVYKGVEGSGLFAAFQHEGCGLLKARLGLRMEAEAELRAAVAATPTDARVHASLAAFLRERGRGKEALAEALQAIATFGTVAEDADRRRVGAAIIGCQLGAGDIDGARSTLALARIEPAPYLKACIDYAAGDLGAAADGFRAAAAGSDGAETMLGLAACRLRQGEWQDAANGFEAVAEQAPLLRHRAWTGMALLELRLGHQETAANWLERALEANPQDTYAFYLKGRTLAAMGQLAQAQEALQQALTLRDDCAPALAEMSALRAQLARTSNAAEQAGHALAAMRYADRAVALSSIELLTLRERQAIAHFAAADLRGARDAFKAAIELAGRAPSGGDELARFAQCGLAVVDYTQERTEDALGQLDRMIQDLQSQKDHPLRKWAEATRKLIDDHAQKEQLEDHFERSELGAVWVLSGQCEAKIDDHALSFTGRFLKNGSVAATRTGAVQKGSRFLAVSVRMQLGAGQQLPDTFAGLCIQTKAGANGTNDFVAQIGLRNGKPYLRLQDGRDDPVLVELKVADPSPTAAHLLEFRVEPRDETRNLRLFCLWDKDVLQTFDIKQLHGQSGTELQTILFVDGAKNAAVDARFDDYHLERRKDG